MDIPKQEILSAIDYIEMDMINGIQTNREWQDVVDKVRAWLEAVEPTLAADVATEPYFDDSLPEEYIEGVIYRQNRRAGKA